MPREARLFTSSAGSAVRGYLKYRANIPPRWIKNARGSRKRIEPEIAESFRSLKRLRVRRPRAQVAIRNAQRELRSVLDRWETAYRKENFYRGIRILLELQRTAQARCKNGHELEGQMQGTQLRYVIKFVADMDKAVKFHRDVLGLKVKFESPGWSEFVTGETTLALHPASDKNPAGKVELGFIVADVEAFYRDMSAMGVLFTMPPKKQDFGGVLAQFVDSEGAHCSVGAEAA